MTLRMKTKALTIALVALVAAFCLALPATAQAKDYQVGDQIYVDKSGTAVGEEFDGEILLGSLPASPRNTVWGWEFYCTGSIYKYTLVPSVKDIQIFGIECPVEGESASLPKYHQLKSEFADLNDTRGAYTVDSITWCYGSTPVTGTFQGDVYYCCKIKVSSDGFESITDVEVNGSKVHLSNVNTTTIPEGYITINYYFVCPKRLSGTTAVDTAIAISQETFYQSDWVILARSDDFADAMSASGLAGSLNDREGCPILLIDRMVGIDSRVEAEIARLGAQYVYIIGGKGAIPADVEGQLSALAEEGKLCITEKPERIAGPHSWDTSLICAEKIAEANGLDTCDTMPYAIIAMSGNFQDALSISSFAYKYGVPILLEDQCYGKVGAVTQGEQVFLFNHNIEEIFAVGGPGAMPKNGLETVIQSIDENYHAQIYRIYGKTGYDTSNAIATFMIEHTDYNGNPFLKGDAVVFASGAAKANGTDALAGCALAAQYNAPLLLVNTQTAMEPRNVVTIDDTVPAQVWVNPTGYNGQQAAFRAYGKRNASTYILGGKYVMPADFMTLVSNTKGGLAEIVGAG